MNSILVTGGCGYIGSHISLCLLEKGYKTIILDSNVNSFEEKINVIKNILKGENNPNYKNLEFYKGDIRDSKFLKKIFMDSEMKEQPIKAVIHLAGLKSVAKSEYSKSHYLDVNYKGTLNLIEIMKSFSCKKIIFSSSATVYGNNGDCPIKEETPLSSINYYGYTKIKAESALRNLYFENDKKYEIMILRYFNPIGSHPSRLLGENPIDKPDNLFPKICDVAKGISEQLTIYGNDWPTKDGTCIRDFVHVMDIAEGHISALEFIEKSNQSINYINLGTGFGTSVMELINIFEEVNNKEIKINYAPRRKVDRFECYADVSLAGEILNWSAKRNVYQMCRDGWMA